MAAIINMTAIVAGIANIGRIPVRFCFILDCSRNNKLRVFSLKLNAGETGGQISLISDLNSLSFKSDISMLFLKYFNYVLLLIKSYLQH